MTGFAGKEFSCAPWGACSERVSHAVPRGFKNCSQERYSRPCSMSRRLCLETLPAGFDVRVDPF